MPIRFHCSECGQLLSISRRRAGTVVDCPACGAPTIVPEMDTVAEADADDSVSESPASGTAPARARRPEAGDDEPEFQLRKAQTDFEELDLTPMVDVTFLLLIFFMLTASFSLQKTIPTPVPDPSEQSASQPIQQQEELLETSIVIDIDENNEIFIDDEPLANPQQIADSLREIMNREQKAEVLVSAADAAYHETVVLVLDAANEVGMQKIRLATRTP